MERKATWSLSLQAVLSILEDDPSRIVDDTVVGRLLTWIQGECMTDVGRLVFLKDECGATSFLLSSNVMKCHESFSFALQFAGIISGSSQDCLDYFQSNGVINHLFDSVLDQKETLCPHLKESFLQSLLHISQNSDVGIVLNNNEDLINLVMSLAVNDQNYHVSQSAIALISYLLTLDGINDNQAKWKKTLLTTVEGFIVHLKVADISEIGKNKVTCLINITTILVSKKCFNGLSFIDEIQLLKAIFTGCPQMLLSCDNVVLALAKLCDAITTSIRLQNHKHLICSDSLIQLSVGALNGPSCVVLSNRLKLVFSILKLICHWSKFSADSVCYCLLRGLCLIATKDNNASEKHPCIYHKELENALHCQSSTKSTWIACLAHSLPFIDKIIEEATGFTVFITIWKMRELPLHQQGEHDVMFSDYVLSLSNLLMSSCGNYNPSHHSRLKFALNNRRVTTLCLSSFGSILSQRHFKAQSDDYIVAVEALLIAQSSFICDSALICHILKVLAIVIKHLPNNDLAALFKVPLPNDECDDIGSKMVSILQHRIWDPLWDVSDSALEVLACAILMSNESQFLCGYLSEKRFWCQVWDMNQTDDSFVRASVLNVVGCISSVETLWTIFLGHINMSLTGILLDVCSRVKTDGEAFARRAAVQLIITFLQNPDHYKELMSFVNDSSYGQPHSTVCKLLKAVGSDFDWELKIIGLTMIDTMLTFMCNACIDDRGTVMKPLTCSSEAIVLMQSLGALKVLLNAFNDCDHPVQMKAWSVLSKMQGNIKCMCGISTGVENVEQLQALSQHHVTCCEFSSLVSSVDWIKVKEELTPTDVFVRNDPVCFLDDMIASATQNDDNLLDCY